MIMFHVTLQGCKTCLSPPWMFVTVSFLPQPESPFIQVVTSQSLFLNKALWNPYFWITKDFLNVSCDFGDSEYHRVDTITSEGAPMAFPRTLLVVLLSAWTTWSHSRHSRTHSNSKSANIPSCSWVSPDTSPTAAHILLGERPCP